MTDAGRTPMPATALLEFFALAERLKMELRHSWLSNGRQESVAEHTWLMALMAITLAPTLEHPVDLGHVLKLIIVHDLAEVK
ncbi:MAG: HD domain-containing protein, partial [Rhizobiales bacterium]|nr:HD domain-containing protein [Hyphomicrobiales bacterium]